MDSPYQTQSIIQDQRQVPSILYGQSDVAISKMLLDTNSQVCSNYFIAAVRNKKGLRIGEQAVHVPSKYIEPINRDISTSKIVDPWDLRRIGSKFKLAAKLKSYDDRWRSDHSMTANKEVRLAHIDLNLLKAKEGWAALVAKTAYSQARQSSDETIRSTQVNQNQQEQGKSFLDRIFGR